MRCCACDLPIVQQRHETHQVHRVFVCENEVYVRKHSGIHTSELRAAEIDGVKSLVGAPEHEDLLTQNWRRVLVRFDQGHNMFDVTVELCPNGEATRPTR